jgi:Rha family phage regulatory protein
MNELILKEIEMTSNELSDLTGKRHDNILFDIRKEIDALGEEGLLIFKESSYTNLQNKEQPCYKFGKDGAMQLALKYDPLTRRKVIVKLEELEKRNNKPIIDTSTLSPELQIFNQLFTAMVKMELSNKEVKQEIQDMRDVISLDSNSWRKDGHDLIVKAAQKLGGNENISVLTTEVYDLIDARCSVSLAIRLTNKRRRMAEEGVCKSKRDKLNKMDVISEDKKLIEIYMAIVKELAIKYGVA